MKKGRAAFVPGVWLGKDTESDQHFVADGSGVFKTRSVKRHPPSRQADLALLQSVTARPWDRDGHFCLSSSQAVRGGDGGRPFEL